MTPFLDQDNVLCALFYPRREERALSFDPRRISVRVAQDILVHGYLYLAVETAPVVLLFHGNGELAAEHGLMAKILTELGLSLLVMDYRGYGLSGGSPSTSHLLNDAITIFDALPELLLQHGISPKQVFIMGRSLGSAAACEIASSRADKIAGLIIDSGFASTQPLLIRVGLDLGSYDENRDGHGNGRKIAHFAGRTLIMHGEQDTLIPPTEAEALFKLSGAQNKRLVIIPDANHNNLLSVGFLHYQKALEEFVGRRGKLDRAG